MTSNNEMGQPEDETQTKHHIYKIQIDGKSFSLDSSNTTKQKLLQLVEKTPECRFHLFVRVEMDHHFGSNSSEKSEIATVDNSQIVHLEHEIQETLERLQLLEQELEEIEKHHHHPHWRLIVDGETINLDARGINYFHIKEIREVTYYLCDVPSQTRSLILTAREILTIKFKEKANQYYLQNLDVHPPKSYKDIPDEPIAMCPDLHFIYIFTGIMPVS
jgi:hypothetical protein